MIQRLIAALFALTLAAPAAALDLSAMTQDERDAFGAAVREYLMDNPQVIMEAVQVLEQRQAEAQAAADVELISSNADEIFDDGVSWVGGNPEGDVTIVEFLDYRCGFCKRAFPEVEKLLETDGNIRLIIKEFPILGDQSVLASRYAVATRRIAGDDAYKAMHDALMTFNGDITLPALSRMANTLGLDGAAIEAEIDSEEITAELRANRALAQRLNITGTPSFVVEDEMLRGFLPYDELQIIVADKRD